MHLLAFTTAFVAITGRYAFADVAKMDRLMELKSAQWEKAQADGLFAGSRLYKKLAARRPCINGVSGRQGEAQYD